MNNNNTFLSFRQPKSAETDASFYIRIVSERIAITFREDGILDMLRSFLEKNAR